MIRTCLFDMGNVLLHFSHEKMCRQMGALCGFPAERMRDEFMVHGPHLAYEKGEISTDQFHAWFETLAGRSIELERLAEAASDIFELNASIVPVLDRLQMVGMRLVLLSNTNEVHYRFVRDRYDVLDRFDALVLSFEAGAVKPEPAIYQAALERIDCPPDECFYTDDIPDYVEAGRLFGLQSEVFTTTAELEAHLSRRGVPI